MKKFILAASTALAATALAPAAYAADTLCPKIVGGNPTCTIGDPIEGIGTFGNVLGSVGAFSDTFTFELADLGVPFYEVLITGSSIPPGGFTSLTGTFSGGPVSFSFDSLATAYYVLPGTYTITVAGVTSVAGASYSGQVFTTAIPEPATWAMMVAGVAAVGMAMRRRSQTTRVAFS